MSKELKQFQVLFHYTESPDGVDTSYVYLKNPKKYEFKEIQAHKTITLNALDKSADLTDLPCDIVLDFDRDDKLIGIEIIGNVIPDEFKS